jgi:hypothetical protein
MRHRLVLTLRGRIYQGVRALRMLRHHNAETRKKTRHLLGHCTMLGHDGTLYETIFETLVSTRHVVSNCGNCGTLDSVTV